MDDEAAVSQIQEIINEVTNRYQLSNLTPEKAEEVWQRIRAAFPHRSGEDLQEVFHKATKKNRNVVTILNLANVVCYKARAKQENIGKDSTVNDCVQALGENDPDVISLINAIFDQMIEDTSQERAI